MVRCPPISVSHPCDSDLFELSYLNRFNQSFNQLSSDLVKYEDAVVSMRLSRRFSCLERCTSTPTLSGMASSPAPAGHGAGQGVDDSSLVDGPKDPKEKVLKTTRSTPSLAWK